jgi:NDP-sugar pyrophosphorylase family protein
MLHHPDIAVGPLLPSPVTALIPAAGPVSESVLALSNLSSPAMIPVAGRPVIQWTMSYLLDIGVKDFVVAVPRRGLFVEEFVECVYGSNTSTSFLVPSMDRGVGYTVAELVRQVDVGGVLVVLGDTLFELEHTELLSGDSPVVLVEEVEESYRWCIAETDDEGWVTGLRDKEPNLEGPLEALIGVYWFPDVSVLRRAAERAVDEVDGRVEMADLLSRVAADHPVRAVRPAQWLDCGNPDRQAAAQRVMLEERAFNDLQVDAVFGTITKRSRDVDKFVDEINYLRLLPPDLAVLFPRVVDHSTERDQPHLTLEFYGYPTLTELFVFENVDATIWRRVFEHLYQLVVEGFMSHAHEVSVGSIRAMYLEKVLARLKTIDGPPELRRLIDSDEPILINGEAVPSLRQQWPAIERMVEQIAPTSIGGVVHGDLCFSNVLYSLRSGVCKLIDPRGSFGRAGIYGDVRYDIAKLWHSVHGSYDFITADLFSLEVEGLKAELSIRRRPYHDQVRDEFEAVFFERFDRREVAFITALLFASLPALHYDHPPRQIAAYLRALQLLDECLPS